MFDNLPDLAAVSSDHRDELERYLSTDPEDVRDGILWWHDRRATFPRLSHMALDYLSIQVIIYSDHSMSVRLLHNSFKRLQLTLNVCLAKDDFSYPMCAAASLSSPRVRSCASASGVPSTL